MKMNYKVILIVIVAIIGTVLACRYISTPKNKENFAIGFYDDTPSAVPTRCIVQMPTPRKDVLESTPDAYHLQVKGFNYTQVPKIFIDGIEIIPLNLSEDYTALTYNFTVLGNGRSYILETTEDIKPELAILSADGSRWILIDSVKNSNRDGHYRWLLDL